MCGLFDVFVGVPNLVENLQWSSFCALFERNPQISDGRLDLELGLPPLTYENIESISKSCPRLKSIWLETKEMSDEDHDVVEIDSSAALGLSIGLVLLQTFTTE